MREMEEERAQMAATAGEDEIARFLHDPSPAVVKALLENIRLTERNVLIISRRKNLPGDLLESISRDSRWKESYPIRLALAANPGTPLMTAFAIARTLRLPDLAGLACNPQIPMVLRHKIDAVLAEKIPSVALGLKRSLARTASSAALLALMQENDGEILASCLNNPRLTEAHLYRLINREATSAGTIQAIAGHPKWSSRHTVRLALARNAHTPLARCVEFFRELRTIDIRNLYADPSAPRAIKPYLRQELLSRGERPEETTSNDEQRHEIICGESSEEGAE